jgi:flagellar export protein FliJ
LARFTFHLEPVLRYKRQLRREAEIRLQQANNQAFQLQQQLRQLRGRLQDMGQSMQQAVRNGRPPMVGWHAQHQLSRQTMCQVDQTSRQLSDQQEQCQRCQHELEQLQIEVESLETLRQHAWEEFQRDGQRADQRQLDELILQRHVRKKTS